MSLNELLINHKDTIHKRWLELIFDTYPPDATGFLRNKKNPFGNPVGAALRDGTTIILDELCGDMNGEQVSLGLDRIIRIRAVQEFHPSQAVAFVFLLKNAIADKIGAELAALDARDGLFDLWAKIDRLALAAFDVHMECRETVNRIRLSEARKRMELYGGNKSDNKR